MTQQESCFKQQIQSSYSPRQVSHTRYGLQSTSHVVPVRFRCNGLLDFTEKASSYNLCNKIPAVTNLTLAGSFPADESIILKNDLLPEFHRTRHLDNLQAKIFYQTCRYNMILGRDLMNDHGIVLNFDLKSMEWDKSIVAMREHPINMSTTSFAMNLLSDAIDGGLDNNDSTFVLDQPSDLHY